MLHHKIRFRPDTLHLLLAQISCQHEMCQFANIAIFITLGPDVITLICCGEMSGVMHNILIKCDHVGVIP